MLCGLSACYCSNIIVSPHLSDLKETTKILRDSHCVRRDQFRADDGKC